MRPSKHPSTADLTRDLDRMLSQGFTPDEIAAKLDTKTSTIGRRFYRERQRSDLAALFTGAAKKERLARIGYEPKHAPLIPLADLIEDVAWLVKSREHPTRIAKRVGLTNDVIYRRLHEAGMDGLAGPFSTEASYNRKQRAA